MKKTEIKKLDKRWGMMIREGADETCEVCGNPGNNPHHIIGRRNFATRWDLDNGICLCSGCHTMRRQSAHQDPMWFSEWIMAKRGEDWYKALRKKSVEVYKGNYEEINDRLR